jgi:cyclase
MLKKRLMGVVVVRDGIAVQSIAFKQYLPIGRPEIVVEYLNTWGVDEIAILDISATRNSSPDTELVRRLSACCQVPLTYGGGIKTAQEMARMVQAGADKVMINHAFLSNPQVVREGAECLGRQCVIVSLDVLRDETGAKVFDYLSRTKLRESPIELAQKSEQLGAGEIFLNSVDRDGSKRGYDLEIARQVASAVKIPVTLCGGVGLAEHFNQGLEIENISAVAAANYFNFTEHSVTITKQYLCQEDGAKLRHDTAFNYAGAIFQQNTRLARKADRTLKEMMFEYHPKEVI